MPPSPVRPATPAAPAAPPPVAAPTLEPVPAADAANAAAFAYDASAGEADAAGGFEVTPTAVDEDDAVIVPPPPVEYLAHTHHPPAPTGPVVPLHQKLSYRQTIIPILLTCGVSFLVLGATRWVCDPGSVLGNQPLWTAALLMAAGVVSLAFGVLTMFQVKSILDAEGRG